MWQVFRGGIETVTAHNIQQPSACISLVLRGCMLAHGSLHVVGGMEGKFLCLCFVAMSWRFGNLRSFSKALYVERAGRKKQ